MFDPTAFEGVNGQGGGPGPELAAAAAGRALLASLRGEQGLHLDPITAAPRRNEFLTVVAFLDRLER
jgi:hypothetical protein